jgi:CRP-like cAMP-binding protein
MNEIVVSSALSRGKPGPGAKGEECLFRKLGAFLELDAAERSFLGRLLERKRSIPRDGNLILEGEGNERSFVAIEGWAFRYRMLKDGRRQILNFILPGDIVGLDAHVIDRAPASVAAITDCSVAEFPPALTLTMLGQHARLASALLWATSREEAFLGERLVSLGRRPADERVGHLMVELYRRLGLVGRADEGAFAMPLTLQHIADALGLSVVHVSRTFTRLRTRGLVIRRNGDVRLPDLAALEAKVEFPGLYLARPLEQGRRYIRAPFA